MFKIKPTKIGLELSDQRVKAVEIAPSRRKSKLISCAIAKIDFTKGEHGVVEAIKTVLNDMKVKSNSRINLSIDTNDVDIKWANRTRSLSLESNEFKERKKFNDLNEEVIHDEYKVPLKKFSQKKNTILRVETNKSTVDKYKRIIESAGYSCGNIDLEPFSLLNGFLNNGPRFDQTKAIALMNVDMTKTTINIVQNKVLYYTKTYNLDWRKLFNIIPEGFDFDFEYNSTDLENIFSEKGKDIYDLFISNYNQIVDFLLKSFKIFELEQEKSVKEIYVCGEVASCRNFDHHLRRTLGQKVLKWNPGYMVRSSKKQESARLFRKSAMSLTIPLGLASHSKCSLNLAPKRSKTLKNQQKKTEIISKKKFKIAFFVFFVLAGVYFLIDNLYISNINPQKYIGKNKQQVILELGDPFMKDYNFTDSSFSEEWIFYPKNDKNKGLVVRFKGEIVINSFLKN